MLVFGTLVIWARRVRRATEFWAAALALSPGDAHGDNDFTDLCLPDGPLLAIQRSDHAAEPEPRLHLDLYARPRRSKG
ncbi:VOC family protein [Rhodococcus sp. ACS1]|uniref:VOC family protein n=1 Tax=Rhodococcus sp. ACS1 TaxID=2028570 RepID=UPI00359C4360